MKALIIGLGKSGIAAMHALFEKGYDISVQDSKPRDQINADVRAFIDRNRIKSFFGTMPESFSDFDMMILSPGVDPENDFVIRAKSEGCEIVGELEMAFRLSRGTFVGITGTNGKTTTTTLVGEIFRAAGRKTNVVGNIGLPVITVCASSTDEDFMIAEVSSFQLQTVRDFRPRVSAILNLTPDHLNRHHTMEEYGRTKARIWENQGEEDYLVINADDPVCMELCLERVEPHARAALVLFSRTNEVDYGAFLRGNDIVFRDDNGVDTIVANKDKLRIIGDHNVENVLAAVAIAFVSGIDAEVIRSVVESFGGVEHRIEFVRELDGVKYYNDSKGTNVDATITALRAIRRDIILIAGGDAKSQDFTELVAELFGRVKHIMFFGRDAHIIQAACDAAGFSDYTLCSDLDECVRRADEISEAGDTVLLSPACASWDMYPNFEVRGDHFKRIVNELK